MHRTRALASIATSKASSRPAKKSLTICAAKDTTENILASATQIFAVPRNSYELLYRLKELLAYEKLIQSRPSLSKLRPTLPPKIKHIHGDAIKAHIHWQHRPGPEEAEGSRVPAARAAAKREKILGGGGHNDKIPEAIHLSALLPELTACPALSSDDHAVEATAKLPLAVPNASWRPERARPQREFGGEGDEGGHVRYGLKGTKRGAKTAGGRLTRGRGTRKARRTWPRQW
ncbi:hypothetical protein FB451DRAFT_1175849 [Mycena latifolia]|nr:hypothetical protein FB451DRAFT_1175849 [Mycena latifolia]